MAATDITVNEQWATIEIDDTGHKVTINSPRGSFLNVGANTVYASSLPDGALVKDGLQRVGEVPIEPGDSVPIPGGIPFVQVACAAGKTGKLIFVPEIG